ncbi:unnamed protein product [Schistocephalus solidus]|uniref:Secreted protein n=1 Tax=Schistocephalus solidus TaxID=70667 RepID=A0A183STU5_SCHSO|nr:unnamed protein product [Schistocephalus solidus]
MREVRRGTSDPAAVVVVIVIRSVVSHRYAASQSPDTRTATGPSAGFVVVAPATETWVDDLLLEVGAGGQAIGGARATSHHLVLPWLVQTAKSDIPSGCSSVVERASCNRPALG